MAEFKTIPIDQIVVPERLRAVEEDHALAIAQSIVEHGLLNPITVRSTRAAKGGNYTLVAGAHRLRAMVLNDESEIEAMVVEADKAEAQLLEITENLFRNELSVIDRAIFVQSYRDVWEQKYGKIDPANNLKQSKGQVGPSIGHRANLVQLLEDEAERGFSAHVAQRMGLSKRSVKRLNQIAQSLSPALRTALRGTPAADNQSLLLKLAKAGPSKQAGIVAGLEKEPDIKKVLAWAKDPAPPISEADKQAIVLHQLKTAWKGADEATRQRFLQSIGLLDDVQEAAQ
ncbi:ParB/RepB/Spo0J family partition protein [Agrobacterium vitis]|uniref:ParB/RepB/Spo0J family partition protein n=1 Tax=Allorhizobium ampelinum TaxID=3025782 RepID=UPI001F30CF57|nr:ParB/RepB/Spo0J family partition protein [Allorhizobium ampelinum]MCF1485650.1 ParB/RepB/Spo0J family partition protein [Allorhizobium ampelinum]